MKHLYLAVWLALLPMTLTAADKKITDLPILATPSAGTFIEVQDTNTAPLSRSMTLKQVSANWVASGTTNSTLAGTATVGGNAWIEGAAGAGGSVTNITNAATTIRQKAGAHALVIDAGADAGFDALKIYGAPRGDGKRYITEFNGANPGLATDGPIMINGEAGDPVPGAVAGETVFALGIHSDVAGAPSVVIQAPGTNAPIWKQYDLYGQNVFSIGDRGQITTVLNTEPTNVVSIADVAHNPLFNINSQMRKVGIGSSNSPATLELTLDPTISPYAPVMRIRNQNTGGTFDKLQFLQGLTNGVTLAYNGNNSTVNNYLPFSFNTVLGTNGTAFRWGLAATDPLGDDTLGSTWMTLQSGTLTVPGSIAATSGGSMTATHFGAASAGVFYWTGRGQIQANANGDYQFVNAAGQNVATLTVSNIVAVGSLKLGTNILSFDGSNNLFWNGKQVTVAP